MKIDRHNYEESFILYWDDELTVSEKQAVQNFVKENPDLLEEFKLLGETRFTPDDKIQFDEKEFLLDNSFINITNYEEQLLNYIDDELDPAQRKEVERFVGQYPAGRKELALFQKTKLQADAEIVFPDKSILYRREEKVRVISMSWFRVAVAAAIILIAGFATFKLVNNSSIESTDVANGGPKKQPANSTPDQSISNPGDQTKKVSKDDLAKVDEKSTKVEAPGTNERKDKLQIDKNDDKKPLIAYQPENKNGLPKEGIKNNQTIEQPNNPEEAIAYNISKENYKAEKSEPGHANNPLDNSSVTKSSFASLDNIVIEDEHDKEKGGLKEFLRKTTRGFERRTKIQTTTDDNKLLIGAFAVSLK